MLLGFFSDGTRWELSVIREGSPHLGAAGLMFSSEEGDRRFLPMPAATLPNTKSFASMSIRELDALIAQARPLHDD